MNFKKICISVLIIFAFAVSCIAGYYTLKYNNNAKTNTKNNSVATDANVSAIIKQTPVTAAVSVGNNIVISEKTKIIKKYNYNMGIPTTKEDIEASGPDTLGMDRKAAEDYFNKQQFYMIDFDEKNVVLYKDINSWPPNYYVVKGEKGAVNIYYTDNNGKLKFLKKSQYTLDGLPTSDIEELEKGKSFPKLEDIDNMFDELTS